MSADYLILGNPQQCPGCGSKGKHPKHGNCPNCGLRLFQGLDQLFQTFADEIGGNFWAFDKGGRGWINRDHLLIAEAEPQKRELNLPALSKDYGTKTTPAEVRARGGTLTKSASTQIGHVRD